ncbi:MAG: hypothetical protein RL272_1299 [Candidatus Parcubacteria bacterium]|jgi:F-type H+-transporting ATPase subunit a
MSVPVAAEKLFMLGSLPVTNSVLTGWVAVAAFVAAGAMLSRRRNLAPKGLQNAAEALIEGMLSFMDQVTQDRRRSRRFLPIVGALFPFILVCNWMGLLPGIGTIGVWGRERGAIELIPLFRPATSDLNMTLAMGITSVVVSHVIGIMTLGFFKYWNKFIQLGTLWKAVAKIGRVPAGKYAIDLFAALVGFMVGLIELMSEAAKMISLSLRLFGNIFAGEVLIHVLSSLIAFVLPTPFMFLEVIVGVVQALVFSMLTLVYLTLATDKPHGDEAAHGEDELGESHGPRQGRRHAKAGAVAQG